MKVKELIEALKKMPQEEDVIMFDGTASYTPKQGVCLPVGEQRSYKRSNN